MMKLGFISLLALVVLIALALGGAPRPREAAGDTSCTGDGRREFLRQEQATVVALLSSYGAEGRDLTVLRNQSDFDALAQRDPESGTAYNLLPHQYVSFAGQGIGILNSGDNNGDPVQAAIFGPPDIQGVPELLLYAPNTATIDEVSEPFTPDFPYTLVGWGYLATYDHSQHPTYLSDCIARGDWFVHERGIHPADDWGMHAVLPPHEHPEERGHLNGQEPITPDECPDDPATLEVESCPAGIPHGRFWDIHFFIGDDGEASTSILSSHTISGVDSKVGENWYHPDGGSVIQDGCLVVDAVPQVPIQNVRPLVPDPFVIDDPEGDGLARLNLTIEHCDSVSVNGGPPRENIQVHFGVYIKDPNGAPTTIPGSSSDESQHQYFFWDVSDNPEWVNFWRDEGGVRTNGETMKVFHVEGLDWQYDRASGAFSFIAPPPTPSPFTLTAVLTQPITPGIELFIGEWATVPRGVMRLNPNYVHDLSIGIVQAEFLTPDPGSDMDRIFCDDVPRDGDGRIAIQPGDGTHVSFHSNYGLVVLPWEAGAVGSAECAAFNTVEESRCEVVQPLYALPPENVRPLVPAEFELSLDPNGKAAVGINIVHCEALTVYDRTRDTTYAHLIVGINDPEGPPGLSDPAALELNSADTWFISDNPDLIRYFREQGGRASDEAVYVKDLVFDGDPAPDRFTFVAPAPAPSPFIVEAKVGEPGPLGGEVISNYWSGLHRGTETGPVVKIYSKISDVRLGSAEGRVIPSPGSELDRVFCDDTDGSWTDPTTHLFLRATYFADVHEDTETSPVSSPTCSTS